MEGSVPFYQNPTSGDTATSVCVLFGIVAALGGLGSAVLNFKDTSGATESIQSSPEGIKPRVKHFDEEVKSERTPLASFPSGIAAAGRTEGDSEFIDNVNTFVHSVAHGSQTFLSSQFGICSGFVFVCTLLVFVAIISWANDDVKFAGLCFLAFVVGSASSLLAAVLCRFLALRLASRVTTLLHYYYIYLLLTHTYRNDCIDTVAGGNHGTTKRSPPTVQISVACGYFVHSDRHWSYHHAVVSAHAHVSRPPQPSVRCVHRDAAAAYRRGSCLVPTHLTMTTTTLTYDDTSYLSHTLLNPFLLHPLCPLSFVPCPPLVVSCRRYEHTYALSTFIASFSMGAGLVSLFVR